MKKHNVGSNELIFTYDLADLIVDNSNIHAPKLMLGCKFTKVFPLLKREPSNVVEIRLCLVVLIYCSLAYNSSKIIYISSDIRYVVQKYS